MTCETLVRPVSFRRTGSPAAEPLTLAEAQAQLRHTDPAHNADVAARLSAARSRAEGYLERCIVATACVAYLDGFWGTADLALPFPNLLSVTAIEYLADGEADASDDDDWTEVDEDTYEVDLVSVPGRVRLRPGQAWPTAYARPRAVRVTYSAGYGSTEASVPDSVRQAVRLLLGSYDRNREGVVVGTIANELPEGVRALLDLERIPWAD